MTRQPDAAPVAKHGPRRIERRKNPRLRELLDAFKANIEANQRELVFQGERVAELHAEIERIKQARGHSH